MAQPKILIVDDRLENLVTLETLLANTPAQTVRAASGNEALALTLEHDFALVLLDVQMPVMDGFEVARLLHESSKTRHLPIIFLSAVYSGDIFQIKGVESGAVDFIEKPIIPELLRGKVHLFLELHEYRKQLVDLSSREIVANISDGTMIVNRNTEILVANNAVKKLLGADPEGLVGSHFSYPLKLNKLQEISIPTSSGEERFVELNVSSMQWSGEDVYIVSLRDISERKKMEEELFQARKMEAIGLMAGGIAHNFNNNLSIILGNVELAQIRSEGNNQFSDCLSDAKTAVLRSRDLVQQILTYGRKTSHNHVPTVLFQVIDETIKLLRSTLPSSVKLEQTNNPENRYLSIMADASRIQEALLNFCNNSVHAMQDKGSITFSLQAVEIDAKDIPGTFNCAPGKYAKLSIQDTGSGMPPETIEKIFDPFFTTKNIHEGTGMGLATVKAIIEQHQGMIKVKSTIGRGTLFAIYFPLIGFRQREEGAITDPLTGGNEHILLVDDEEMLVSVWSSMLRDYGYQVTVETSSQKALQKIQTSPDQYDLIVTDQTMPDLTGKELALEIKTIRPDLPIILCSGFSSRINEEEAARIGIDSMVMKPLDLADFLKEIRKVLAAGT